MNVLLIEDELPAARRLEKMLNKLRPGIQISGPLESIEESVEWLKLHPAPDLLFLDIQLSDGLSFEIFREIQITQPVIFTTAFDEYALQAFKVNSVDYLLKPIDEKELEAALRKHEQNSRPTQNSLPLEELIRQILPPAYKTRFLLKKGHGMIPVTVEDIAYFFASEKMVVMHTHKKETYILDQTLDQLEKELDPSKFFRANRKFLISATAVTELRTSFNGKLRLMLKPQPDEDEIYVSRERAADFKNWLGA